MQNQVATKLSNGVPPRRPWTLICCPATVPASIVPAAISVLRRATATWPLASTESSGSPMASARTRSDGPKLCAPWAHRPGSKLPGSLPNPIRSNSSTGELRCDRSAYS